MRCKFSWIQLFRRGNVSYLTFFPSNLCTLNLPKLEQCLSLIMSFPRNMAFRWFVITLLVMLHSRHIKYQSRRYDFPTTTSQANMFSASWDNLSCRWMTPNCDVWTETKQFLRGVCRAFPLILMRALTLMGKTGT